MRTQGSNGVQNIPVQMNSILSRTRFSQMKRADNGVYYYIGTLQLMRYWNWNWKSLIRR